MVIVIDEEKYNPERTITKSQKFIIFNHIDQYFKCCNPKDNNSFRFHRISKFKVYLVVGKYVLQFAINLNPNLSSYSFCAPTRCATSLINGTTHHQLFNALVGKIFHISLSD